MIDPGDIFLLPKAFKPYSTQMLFYLLFADHKEVWASHKKLEAVLGFSVRTVIRTVAQLEELGIISVKRFQGGEVNRYKLNLDALSSFLSQFSTVNGSSKELSPEDLSSNASENPLPSSSPGALRVPPEASIDTTEATDLSSLQGLSQDASSDLAGNDDKSPSDPEIDPAGNDSDPESYFDDPRTRPPRHSDRKSPETRHPAPEVVQVRKSSHILAPNG